MILQKVTELKEVANYTNISNTFKVDYLESTFTDLSSYQRDITTGICVITMLGIIFTNVTVIIFLFKTNQINNLSFRTILHLTFSDVLFALFGVPTFTFGSFNKTSSRLLEIASPCFIVLFSYVHSVVVQILI